MRFSKTIVSLMLAVGLMAEPIGAAAAEIGSEYIRKIHIEDFVEDAKTQTSAAAKKQETKTAKQPAVKTKQETPHFDEDISVLFIGNSITYHEFLPQIWYGAWGMAATEPAKDYVHQTGIGLYDLFEGVDISICKLAQWECPGPGTTRLDYTPVIGRALETKPDVVVLQLGENVLDSSTFLIDFMYLIETIKNTSPDSRLIMIGETISDWDADNVEQIKQSVAEYYDIPYIDTTEIRDVEKYQAGLGYIYTGIDDVRYEVISTGVGHHLNNAGMKWIADQVVDEIVSLYGGEKSPAKTIRGALPE